MNLVAAIFEGLHFLWSFRRASSTYAQWRLGTVYGSFDRSTGAARPVRELLGDLWRDRVQVGRFLAWRRSMRGPKK